MNRKVKGFTLLETIITLTIMVVVLAVVSSVFINSRKLMVKTELKSQLQEEGEKFQKTIVTYGTQAISVQIKAGEYTDTSSWTFDDYIGKSNAGTGYLTISNICFGLYPGVNGDTNVTVGDDEYLICNIGLESVSEGKQMFTKRVVKCDLATPTNMNNISTSNMDNLKEVTVIPLNWQELCNKRTKDDSDFTLSNEITGLKVTAKFKKKQGNIEVEYEVSSIVKFRNN